jgi:hypothetical protein
MIREQTHILVAISGSVGADRLCRLTEVLNIAAKRRRLDDLEALHAPCRDDLDDLIALIALRSCRATVRHCAALRLPVSDQTAPQRKTAGWTRPRMTR